MTKHTIELSADSYKRFEALKNILKDLSNETELNDEDVIDFAVREITESIKMMQEHQHNHHHDHGEHQCCGGHGGDCCGGWHCHDNEGENHGCCRWGHCC